MPRCAIYTRQSTVASHQETSCNGQFERCHRFLKSRAGIGWEWIGERLDDPGFSGATMERPALQKLLGLVAAGRVDVLIVEYLDRLSRRVADTLELLQRLRGQGIEVCIATSPELAMSASSNFMINLLASFAEFERELIRERIREGRAFLKSHGRRVGGAVAYGYNADPRTRQLVTDLDEANHVRAFFELAAAGMPPRQIAHAANERGWRTKRREVRRTGQVRGGNLWTARQVLAVLSNPTYLGKITQGAGLAAGVQEALVSESLYAQVRQLLESRRTRKPCRRRDRPGRWLLKGRLRCAQCGRIMSPHTTRRGAIVYPYYRCRSQAQGRPPCKAIHVLAYEIETFVIETLAVAPTLAKSQSPEERQSLQQFTDAWGLLSEDRRRQLLPEVVCEVLYDPRGGRVSLTLDPDFFTSTAAPADGAAMEPGEK